MSFTPEQHAEIATIIATTLANLGALNPKFAGAVPEFLPPTEQESKDLVEFARTSFRPELAGYRGHEVRGEDLLCTNAKGQLNKSHLDLVRRSLAASKAQAEAKAEAAAKAHAAAKAQAEAVAKAEAAAKAQAEAKAQARDAKPQGGK